MKTVYGVRMIDLQDILQYTGRPAAICNYLKEHIEILDQLESNEKYYVDTNAQGDFAIYNMLKAYKMVFVSVDLLEEKIIKQAIDNALYPIAEIFVDMARKEKISKILDRYDNAYYATQKSNSGESIINKSSFMFLFDEKDDLMDVYIVIPRILFNKVLLSSQEYKCVKCHTEYVCDNADINNFIPPYYYNVEDNQVVYYCDKCGVGQNLKHVGE